MTKPRRALPDLTLDAALDQFTQDLRIDKSPKTIATYREAVGLYARHAAGVSSMRQITTASIREWLLSLKDAGRSPGTIFNRYNGLRAFLTWATADGQLDENPILAIGAPKPEVKPVPMLTVDQMKALLKACEGTAFENIRDTAMIRLLLDTGMRRAECANLKAKLGPDGLVIGDLDFEQEVAIVLGKGNRVRACPFGPKTAKDLRRYLRARYGHDYAHLPDLWISRRGALKANGVLHMLQRRAKAAGIPGRVFVHQLRHTWAHEALSSGLQEGDVMRLGGWKDRAMLSRYAASGADERARNAYRNHSLGDRL